MRLLVRKKYYKIKERLTIRENPSLIGGVVLLIECPACSKDVSPKAPACPNCGEPLRNLVEKASGAFNIKDPVHFLGVVALAIIILGIILLVNQALTVGSIDG